MTIKKPSVALLVCLCAYFLPTGAGAEVPAWDGEYGYYANYGESYGGSSIGAQYTVVIGEELSRCEIEVSGYQTHEQIVCIAEAGEDSVRLLFKSYFSGDTKNVYGVEIYRPGQALLEFERGPAGLVTHWHGMRGLDGELREPGRYFEPSTAH